MTESATAARGAKWGKLILLTILAAACGGLAILWVKLRREGMQLVAQRQRLEWVVQSAESGNEVRRKQAESSAEQLWNDQTAIRYPLFSRRIERANAIVAELRRRKETRGEVPVPEKLPQTPTSSMGYWFPELMNDPEYGAEYRRLYRETIVIGTAASQATLLQVPTEMRAQAVSVLADWELERLMHYDRARSMSDNGAEMKAWKEREKHFESELSHWAGPGPAQRMLDGSWSDLLTVVHPLETRLSYSEQPLDPAVAMRVRELAYGRNAKRDTQLSDAVVPLLTAQQRGAWDELEAEQQAGRQRMKLPRSSALPKIPGM